MAQGTGLHLRMGFQLLVLVLISCGNADRPAGESAPKPPDVGDVDQFLDCAAQPRRPLSDAEQCKLALLRPQCT